MVEHSEFPEYHRLLCPRIALLVTALRKDGLPNSMVAAWHTPVSINPPILAISITPARMTHRLIQETGEFTLSIPDESMLAIVIQAGSVSGEVQDKSGLFQYAPALRLRTPIIKNALGNIECELNRMIETGDHSVIFGNVLATSARGFNEVWTNSSPLLHLGSDYYTVMGKRINSKDFEQ